MSKIGFFPDTWMGRGVCTPAGGGLTDTFLMARRQTLWPQLATTLNGSLSWTGNGSRMFGGYLNKSSASVAYGEEMAWANVPLQAGTWKINVLHSRFSNGGIAHVFHNGVDTGARLDFSGAEGQVVVSDTFTVSAKALGTLSLKMLGTSGTYYGYQIQQVELVKTSADSDAGTSLDDLPWCVDVPPVSYDSTTGPVTLTQSTSTTWGSYVRLSDAINEYTEYKVWLAEGTYTMSMVSVNGTNGGIATLTIDGGSSLGTVDTYNGSTTYNNVGTITSISVATTGVHTVRLTAATKNASSGGYNLDVAWLQFRKTTTTGAITATGATYGRETAELWPWFADTTDSDTFTISGAYLYYGRFQPFSIAINDSQIWAVSLTDGTYNVEEIGLTLSYGGIVHLSNGGADLDTADLYSASTTYNVKSVMSGSLTSGNIALSMDSKNASSTGYGNLAIQIRLTRTGA